MKSISSYNLPALGTPYWSQGNQSITLIAITFGLNIATFSSFGLGLYFILQPDTPEATIFLVPLLSGVLGFISVWYAGKTLTASRRVKWVALDIEEAQQLLKYVLQEMNLPYQNKGEQFHLRDSDLILRIRRGYLQYSLTRGAIIIFTPLHSGNLAQANALRQHIDTALKPRGLTP